MKYLILIAMATTLTACGDSNSYTTTGTGASINIDGSSGTTGITEDPAPVIESSEECSEQSRIDGVC